MGEIARQGDLPHGFWTGRWSRARKVMAARWALGASPLLPGLPHLGQDVLQHQEGVQLVVAGFPL